MPEAREVAEAIERLAEDANVTDLDTPALSLLSASKEPEAVLRLLARSRSTNARMWIVFAVADHKVPASDVTVELLEMLADDRDPDIRTETVRTLVTVNPSSVRKLVPRLLGRLHSLDYDEPVDAMWALAELDAKDAIQAIRAASAQWRPGQWQHTASGVVLDYLEQRHDHILSRIRAHDHAAMRWLARAASFMKSEASLQTLHEAEQAFANDLSCLNSVRSALGKPYVGEVPAAPN